MKKIQISDSEWAVMKVLWVKSPLTAGDIYERLDNKAGWHIKTVKTLINRLMKKKHLEYEKQGREYLYTPAVTEEECVLAESESFLDRVFGGSLQPMLVQLVKHQKLSASEIQELKKILDQKGGRK